MSVAEAIFTLGSIAFSGALLPTLLNKKSYVPKSSSLLTAAVLTTYVYAFFSIGQVYSASTGALTAAMWWAIFALRGNPEVLQ